MIELQSVTWRNFLSYGDYDTTIHLSDLGQCLITGEVIHEDKEVYDSGAPNTMRKSNGAGKSTIPNAIQWCLFGRTMHSANPGNKVVNWFTGKDCVVTVEFKNGDKITRVRNSSGHNELFYARAGDEHKFESDTLSVAKNQQAQLAKEFGLDWEVFCGSVFFNQYGKPWMEMADATRKKAIERVLHIDRFLYYSKVSKEKADTFDLKVVKSRNMIAVLKENLSSYEQQVNRLKNSAAVYIENQKGRRVELLKEALNEKTARDAIMLPDIEKLRAKWMIVTKIKNRLIDLRKESNTLITSISEISGTIRSLNSIVNNWRAKAGRICTSCEQSVSGDYTNSKIEPILEQIKIEENKISRLNAEKENLSELISKTEQLLNEKKPQQTIEDAENLHKQWVRHDKAFARNMSEAEKILDEQNPHDLSVEEIEGKIADVLVKIKKLEGDIERDDYIGKHYSYVYKAYSDRTKIKSYVFKEHIPYINNRLSHYLDVFGLDVKIELNDSLGITSNLWGYDFESGGERKRTDVAFMLAMFDFHEQMYGRQCNVLVLDEVDGRMDDDGIDGLINIIKNDLASRAETIFIISHKNMMFDTFPNEIKAVRTNRFSQLVMA